MRNLWRSYWRIIGDKRRRALGSIALLAASGSCEGVALLMLAPVLSAGNTGGGRVLGRLTPPLALAAFLILGLLSALAKLLADRAVFLLRCDTDRDLRSRLTTALFAMRWSAFLSLRLGAINNAALVEANNAASGVQHFLFALGFSATALIYLALVLAISVPITLLTLAFAAIAVLGYKRAARSAAQRAADLARLGAEIGDQTTEKYSSLKFLRATGGLPPAEAELNLVFTEYAGALFEAGYANSRLRAVLESGGIIFVGVFLMVFLSLAHGSPSTAIAFLAIFYRLTPRLQMVQEHLHQARHYWAWCDEWERKLARAQQYAEAPTGQAVPRFDDELAFERMGFAYPDTERRVLDGFTYTLSKGMCVAIVGESGSGKSTLLDLVTGLQTPTEGRITLDGVSLDALDINAWRNRIGLVMQESPVFHTTILENIAWGDPQPDRPKARHCAELASAWEFIAELPDGFDAVVGERGGRLSGGQRQRIALARALYRDPWLLILDEATSALDSESERRIQDALEGLKGRFAIILVAHRLKTVAIADDILVLKNGRVAEHGSWRALLSDPESAFTRMVAMQGLQADSAVGEALSDKVKSPASFDSAPLPGQDNPQRTAILSL